MLEKLGGALASDNEGARYLMDIKESPMYVVDIYSGPTSVRIDCGSGAESYGGRKG